MLYEERDRTVSSSFAPCKRTGTYTHCRRTCHLATPPSQAWARTPLWRRAEFLHKVGCKKRFKLCFKEFGKRAVHSVLYVSCGAAPSSCTRQETIVASESLGAVHPVLYVSCGPAPSSCTRQVLK